MNIQLLSLCGLLLLLLVSLVLRIRKGAGVSLVRASCAGQIVGSVPLPMQGQLHIIAIGNETIALFTSVRAGSAMLHLKGPALLPTQHAEEIAK